MSEKNSSDRMMGENLRASLAEAPEAPFLERRIWNAIENQSVPKKRAGFRMSLLTAFAGALGLVSAVVITSRIPVESQSVAVAPTAIVELESETSLYDLTVLENEAGETIVSFYEML